MRELYFTEDMVKSYYKGDFANDLRKYFDIETCASDSRIPIILHMEEIFNQHSQRIDGCPANRKALLSLMNGETPIDATPLNFMFSGILLHMILTQQALSSVVGKNAEKSFHICSGWPLFSAGLGGHMLNAFTMLREANLAPMDAERENYVRMLKVISPFIIKEVTDFISGKNSANIDGDAYSKLAEETRPNLIEIIDWIQTNVKDITTLLM